MKSSSSRAKRFSRDGMKKGWGQKAPVVCFGVVMCDTEQRHRKQLLPSLPIFVVKNKTQNKDTKAAQKSLT
jgi:hypothetical protein